MRAVRLNCQRVTFETRERNPITPRRKSEKLPNLIIGILMEDLPKPNHDWSARSEPIQVLCSGLKLSSIERSPMNKISTIKATL